MKQYKVGVAPEDFSATVLSQAGCEESIQDGADQPGHDLVATRGSRAIKVSVKSSQDEGWGLIQADKDEGVRWDGSFEF